MATIGTKEQRRSFRQACYAVFLATKKHAGYDAVCQELRSKNVEISSFILGMLYADYCDQMGIENELEQEQEQERARERECMHAPNMGWNGQA